MINWRAWIVTPNANWDTRPRRTQQPPPETDTRITSHTKAQRAIITRTEIAHATNNRWKSRPPKSCWGLYRVASHCIIFYRVGQYCLLFYCMVFYWLVSDYTILYDIVSYFIVLYSIVWYIASYCIVWHHILSYCIARIEIFDNIQTVDETRGGARMQGTIYLKYRQFLTVFNERVDIRTSHRGSAEILWKWKTRSIPPKSMRC